MSKCTVGIVGDVHFLETPPVSRKDDYLESLLLKINHVCSECDIVVFLGDLFHRPGMSTKSFSRVISFFMDQIIAGKKFYSIIGNHDVPNFSLTSFDQTSLGILSSIRFINIINEPGSGIDIGPLTIDAVPFAYDVRIETEPRSPVSFLLGHCFFDNTSEEQYSLSPEEVAASGYTCLFLGHDHAPYPDVVCGGTRLIRVGSLCRNTSHAYQLSRTPKYIRVVVEGDQVSAPELREAGGLDPQEVFYAEVFETPSSSELIHVAKMEGILARFSNRSATSDQHAMTISRALQELEAPSYVVDYVKSCYEEKGMTFR